MTENWWVIGGLAIATFAIRYSGIVLGQKLPSSGPWAHALQALPGCLIAALVTVLLLDGGPVEWLAGGVALLVALLTRNLPLTMIAGISTVFLLRQVHWLAG
ncbi:MAG: AzlD domain-containing protein [Pseudomonadota bacterium]